MSTLAETLQLARQCEQSGDAARAEQLYRDILRQDSNNAAALLRLGTLCLKQGKPAEAADLLRRATAADPTNPHAHSTLGIALAAQGNMDEAIVAFEQAVALRPDDANLHSNLGNALRQQGRLSEALEQLHTAVGLDPANVGALYNLGLTFEPQGKLEDAILCFRRLLALAPQHAEAHACLGRTLAKLGSNDEALDSLRQALLLNPNHPEAHNSVGVVLARQGKLQEAVDHFQQALKYRQHAEAFNNVGNALKDRGEVEEALASYRRALELKPDYVTAHSNLLYALQYRPAITLAELAQAHGDFDRQHAAAFAAGARPNDNSRDPERLLRLGFVSPDLGRHPVGLFLIRVLESLDRRQCETICYSDRYAIDELTERFRAVSRLWRDVPTFGDERLAEQIRTDRVDILFDLSGHTANNRLLVFARKPAPIQATWIGYEGTTGLSAIDYLIADRWLIPEGTEKHYREKVLRMPDGYVCFEPPSQAPDPGPLPALANGHVTFGSFNNLAKLGPEVVAVWAQVLNSLPSARLVLKYRGLADPACRSRFEKLFAEHGVDVGRLELRGLSSYAEMLSEYRGIDLALDPFPFSGGATTCDALWMGVPVITCPGETFAGRHSLSHLANIGLPDTIARDTAHYIELAVELANDLQRLAKWRSELRDRMARSPLCDGSQFAGNLMKALRDVWREWCSAGINPRSG